MNRTDCVFVKLNPAYHYNESEILDPYVYRCYSTRFFIDSTKAAVFAGRFSEKKDEDLFIEAGIQPIPEPQSNDLEEFLEYKKGIVGMVHQLIDSKKFTFLKEIEIMFEEPAIHEMEQFYNYFGMHDIHLRAILREKTKENIDKKRKAMESKMKNSKFVAKAKKQKLD